MDKLRKLELIQRSLGLRHKLKVHESMKSPETHEEVSVSLITKWEFEDELRAIEEILAEERSKNVGKKREVIVRETKEFESGTGPAEGNSRKKTKK